MDQGDKREYKPKSENSTDNNDNDIRMNGKDNNNNNNDDNSSGNNGDPAMIHNAEDGNDDANEAKSYVYHTMLF